MTCYLIFLTTFNNPKCYFATSLTVLRFSRKSLIVLSRSFYLSKPNSFSVLLKNVIFVLDTPPSYNDIVKPPSYDEVEAMHRHSALQQVEHSMVC